MTSHDQRLRSPARLVVVDQPVLAEVVKLALDHGALPHPRGADVAEAAAALTDWRPHLAVVDMDIAGSAMLDRLAPRASTAAASPSSP